MDYDKLIEQYRQAADKWEKRHPVTDTFDLRVQDALRDAVTAIETIQADLARVTAERDAAISDLETVMAYKYDACKKCKASTCYMRGGTKPCLPKWRGIKED